jgi:hypothetical protein
MGHVMPDARWTMKRASTSQRSFGSVTDYRTRVMLLAPPDRARGGGIKTLAGSPVVATKQALGLNNGAGQDVGLPKVGTLITPTQSGQSLLNAS